jgi:Tfp pilus assembly protein PilN
MIEINLLPSAGKKTRSRGASLDVGALLAGVTSRVKDPYLISALAFSVVAIVAVGGMYWYQRSRTIALDEQLQRAEQDSIRYAAVITQKRRAEAQRDSVMRQVALIEWFDNKRFVWPHIMDEVSRALPPYTWLTSIVQTNTSTAAQAAPVPAGKGKDGKPVGPPPVDTTSVPVVRFRINGNTVDIQALTRFMKLLEASPFIRDVQLVRSEIMVVEGKEITGFQLDASYQVPDPSAIKTVPVALSVR